MRHFSNHIGTYIFIIKTKHNFKKYVQHFLFKMFTILRGIPSAVCLWGGGG